MLIHQTASETEYRYDRATLDRVMNLAERLQAEHQATLSAYEIEEIGKEVGLDPVFIQKALAHVTAKQRKTKTTASRGRRIGKAEFWTTLAAFAIPPLYAFLAAEAVHAPARILAALIAPLPIAGALGFLTGKKKTGFLVGMELAVALFFVFLAYVGRGHGYIRFPDVMHAAGVFLLGGIPVLGGLGALGAALREKLLPPAPPESAQDVSQPGLLMLLSALQTQVEGQQELIAAMQRQLAGAPAPLPPVPPLETGQAVILQRGHNAQHE
jgi:hypothetical protein